MNTYKGFIKNINGDYILPITRAELVLDASGMPAFSSSTFAAEASVEGTGGRYGLVSPTTLELINSLTSGTDGGSLGDIYNNISKLNTKLSYINSGLTVGDTILNFYTTEESPEPTPIEFSGGSTITLNASNNKINMSLASIHTNGLTTESGKILTGITVDKYGRVSELTSNNVLESLTLSGCHVPYENIGDSDTALVNKKYVVEAIANVKASVTGSLKFAGNVADEATARDYCVENNINKYYKVSNKFSLSSDYIHDASALVNLDIGDTLIVYKNDSGPVKFTHIPSGDEEVTVLSVANGLKDTEGTYKYIIENQTGLIGLNFNSPFSVTNTNNFVSISLPEVSDSNDGYLSSTDYNKFMASANKVIEYTSLLNPDVDDSGKITTPGVYKIGTLTIGTDVKTIYGQNNISSLALSNNNNIPELVFTETGVPEVVIKIEGGNGISASANNNTLTFTSTNAVNSQDNYDKSKKAQYLSIEDNHKFSVILGTRNGGTINDGVTDYREFTTFQDAVIASALTFEEIGYSLKDSESPGDNDPFRYGNQALRDIITVTI